MAAADPTQDKEVKFIANPTQHAAITSRYEADLFSCRVGEGKSAALCWASFYHQKHNPGAEHAFIRTTFVDLERTTQKEFFNWFRGFGVYQAQKRYWRWHDELGGGGIYWFGLDNEEDVDRLRSMDLAGAFVDEAAPANEDGGIPESAFGMLQGRLRQKKMRWYKLMFATNNPDETHWTYRNFVDPGLAPSPKEDLLPEQMPGFKLWKTASPENLANLPAGQGYYNRLMKTYVQMGRQDLAARFVEGKFGVAEKGVGVTSAQWNPDVHLVRGPLPFLEDVPIRMAWDFGHTPTCLVSQLTPAGHWDQLYAFVGKRQGVAEIIEAHVIGLLTGHAPWFAKDGMLLHTGDPNGETPDQASYRSIAVKMILQGLGGLWAPGPPKTDDRIQSARAVLRRMNGGMGFVRVSATNASLLYLALRGGWHFPKNKSGVVGNEPVKDQHSHPGDAFGYAAAKWFPTGDALEIAKRLREGEEARPKHAGYWPSPDRRVMLPKGGESLEQFAERAGVNRWSRRQARGRAR
jgi:hypothetical protein